jgi:hypothetical protein
LLVSGYVDRLRAGTGDRPPRAASYHGATWEEVLVMVALVAILVILVVAGLIVAGRSFKVVQQYEQGII